MNVDVATLVPILVAFLSGGAATLYTARSNKTSIIAGAAEKAVTVVSKAIEHLEEENKTLRKRIVCLEAERTELHEAIEELRTEVKTLKEAIG